MNILLVGSGGREHALAWKIAQSPLVRRLVAAPGNPGMEKLCEIRALKADDAEGLAALAREIKADLVVVGPEVALAAGLAREEGPVAARDSAVEQFARMVDAATDALNRR